MVIESTLEEGIEGELKQEGGGDIHEVDVVDLLRY